MLFYHLFSFVLGLFGLAVSALSVAACLWNLRHSQPEIRWWWPAVTGLTALALGLGRVSAAFDPGDDISTRTLALGWAASAIGLVGVPCIWVSLLRSRRAKSAGANKPAA